MCDLLLQQGHEVVGYDGMTDYYAVSLKERRLEMLAEHAGFACHEGLLEDFSSLDAVVMEARPQIVVHLAAQAGVRYSLKNPQAYIDANIVGTFNVMECARKLDVHHLLMASTSSVYGANEEMPFDERQQCDSPLTLYAATKKANEAMGHSYAHLWNLPTTMFRFFTDSGPWGLPDMALFKFTRGILNGDPIDNYANGEMYPDFTYVTYLESGIALLMDAVPKRSLDKHEIAAWDSLSPVAAFRVVNIGNSKKVKLTDFVDAIEAECGREAKRNFLEMQKGDVPATWADATLLQELTGYRPQTNTRDGVRKFVDWYRNYYNV